MISSNQQLISILRRHQKQILSEWFEDLRVDAIVSAFVSGQPLKSRLESIFAQLLDYLTSQKKLPDFLHLFASERQKVSVDFLIVYQKIIFTGKEVINRTLESHFQNADLKFKLFHEVDEILTRACLKSYSHFWNKPVAISRYQRTFDLESKDKLLSRLNLFYNAFLYSTDGIIITDLKGKIMEVNNAFLKIFGYDYDEVIGRTTNFLRSKDTEDDFYQEMWQSINTTGEWKGEIINRCKNGKEIPIWLSITPVYENGQRIGYMGVEIDISEKKQIEKALIQEKMFTESLIETANSLIVGLNLHGEITLFNKKLEEVTGYKKTEVMGKNWFDVFVPAEVMPTVKEIFRTIVDGNIPSFYENAIVSKNGEERYIAWSNTPIHNERNEVIGALGIGQDVTEQRHLEQQILQSERLAMIGQMAAKVAHEIRNPLSSISLNAELLGDEIRSANENVSEDAEVLLKSIMSEVDRVALLTEEYLQFSRLPDADPQPGNLVNLVQEVVDFIEPEASSKGVQIIADYRTKISKLVFDAQQIRRVLLNIVRNALDAMKNGGILSVKIYEKEKYIEIAISDTGEGIREADKEKIFEPFYTTKDMGTGLGLAISQQIIQEHGGKIYFQSSAGEGTTFFLQLPKRKKDLRKN